MSPNIISLREARSLLREEWLALFSEWGEPAYRVDQILKWIYQQRATSWAEMTNLGRALRERLAQQISFANLALVTTQGTPETTVKFLWRLADGQLIESVLIPANPAIYGETSDRHTLCVSTQVGCAYRCKFCASGLLGWKRNLAAEEIVNQVLEAERWMSHQLPGQQEPPEHHGRQITNLVIMGMGEPLANYEALLKALRILNAPWGGGIGARKITVSTSGLAPQIRRLAEEPFQFRLAISLHGATDEVRNRLMPVNRKFPLAELLAACEYYVEQKGKMISLEYILIAGVNDSLNQVAALANLARKLHAKINLIPYNHVEGLPWTRPSEGHQTVFLDALKKAKVPVTLRHEKGHDIDAACGQLRLRNVTADGVIAQPNH
jgi:23S rRNA (adenine2503-C2)-methyltransferase